VQPPQPVVGRLVTHSDGFWHLFDKERNLLSIPDEQVSAVQTFGDTDTTPELAIRPLEATIYNVVVRDLYEDYEDEHASAEDTKPREEHDTQTPPRSS
jgi:hypothetical protein